MAETNKIHKRLDRLFESPKSKNFINHLVRSYLPVYKIEKVVERPKGRFKCVITDQSLISLNEAFEGIQSDDFKNDFLQHARTMFDEEQRTESPMKKMLKGRVLAFTGEKTDTYMSQEGFHAFYDWVVGKMLKGDKHINWLLSSMQREQFLDRAELVADDEESKKALAKIKSHTNKGRKPSTTFGDLEVLQQLKAKMEGKS